MSQTETLQPAAQRWLRYWRNSLADAESGQGALTQKALDQTEYLERTVYRDGYLPSNHPVLKRLFEGEKEATQLVRIALRPAVYKGLQEHGVENSRSTPRSSRR